MPEFLRLLSPEQAWQNLLAVLSPKLETEKVSLIDALGRVTAMAITAPHSLPDFPRTTVDGFAVRALDTYGASESLPTYLELIGEIPMGAAPNFALAATQCALIHTGGMLPNGADAVVMLEHTQPARQGEIEIQRPVAVGENVIRVGEDVAAGDDVIAAGVRLRPAEIGGLAALGLTELDVTCRPRVGLLSTGDEIISCESEPSPGQVRDVNTYTLAALVRQAGGEPISYGIFPDKIKILQDAAAQALAECDVLVITAGSSASTRDLTADVINHLGQPGVLVHGVNVRPGKPTILAVCDRKPVVGLPGNPVSALVIAELFLCPLIDVLSGLVARPQPSIKARLKVNLPSQAGREDYIPVRIISALGGSEAEPVFGKSNLIFTLARSDGLICIPPDATGLPVGQEVDVFLLR